MDYHAIYKKAFSAVREAYPCSDHETAFENVVKRAGGSVDTQCRLPMPFTDGGKDKMKNDENVKRINAKDLPAPDRSDKRRSRAPMIGGIAAGVAAALGVGFFAGNIAGGGITITPLKEGGAGYHAETTLQPEPVMTTAAEEEVTVITTSEDADTTEESENEYTGFQYFFQSFAHGEQINAPAPTVHYSMDENEPGIAPSELMPVIYDFGNVKVRPESFEFDGIKVRGWFDLIWEDGIPEDQYRFTGDHFKPEVWLGETNEPSGTATTMDEGASYFIDADGKTMHCAMTVTLNGLHDSIDLRFIHETEEYVPDYGNWTKPVTVIKADNIPSVKFNTETEIPLISGRSSMLYEIEISPSTAAFSYSSPNDDYWVGFEAAVITNDGSEYLLERDNANGYLNDQRVIMLYSLAPLYADNKTIGDIAAFRFIDSTDSGRDTVVQLYTSDVPAVTSTAIAADVPETTYVSDEITG